MDSSRPIGDSTNMAEHRQAHQTTTRGTTATTATTSSDTAQTHAASVSLSQTMDSLSLPSASHASSPKPRVLPGVSVPSYASLTLSRTSSTNLPFSLGLTDSSLPSPTLKVTRKSSSGSIRSMTASPSAFASPRRPSSSSDMGRAPSSLSSYASNLPAQIEEPPAPTAASVASDFFARDLQSHQGDASNSDTVVIIHDACYGHRFSRPKTTKSSLSMIVERPERILACALGVSQAYVRLGSRHKHGSNPPHPSRTPGSSPPFKIRKSARSIDLTSPAVVAVHGKKWMEELKLMCDSAGTRLNQGLKELARQDDITSTSTEKPTFHEGDLYLCAESLHALQGAVGGVCDAVDQVFDASASAPHRAFVAVRPPGHHCSSDWPSGFCWINNVHIGIEYAAQNYGLTHAAIFDFDLHHGDGSQEVTWDHNTKSAAAPKNTPFSKKTAIGYYSMHDINSYPCEWGDKEKVQNASLCIDNAHGQSIWNVHLQSWNTLDEFWALYETKYSILLDKARAFLKLHTSRINATPKLGPAKAAIFISAGFDASEWEGAGMQRHAVNVPTEFYARFTRDVVKLAHEEGTAVGGRVISVLEGGYSDRALTSGVLSHLSGLSAPQASPKSDALVAAVQKMNLAAMGIENETPREAEKLSNPAYDVNWWDISNITALEDYIAPPPLPAAPKKPSRLPTYATPTESFTQKVVDPETFKRSISGTMRDAPFSLPTSHPIPEVDWIVATHELSKLLIPKDRQTQSCKPEELAPIRMKKERLSGPAAIPVDTGRQLRGRKAKDSDVVVEPPDIDSLTDALKRQTIVDLPSASGSVTAPSTPGHVRAGVARGLSERFMPIDMQLDLATAPPVPAIPTAITSKPIDKEPAITKARKPRAPVTKPKSGGSKPASPVSTSVTPAPAKRSPSKRPPVKARAAPALPSGQSSTPDHSVGSSGSGPKRIMLKLGTREQSERKTQERLYAEKQEQLSNGRSASGYQPVRAPHSVPQLGIQVPIPSETLVASQQTTAEPPRVPDGEHQVSLGATEPTPPSMDDQPISPPMFTPTSMSAFHSPILSPHELKDGRNGYVQYEFQPRQQQTEEGESNGRSGVGQGSVDDMVRQSLLVHPKMVIATGPQSSGRETGSEHAAQGVHVHGVSRDRLPVFSSTGTIPFAPSTSLGVGEEKEEPVDIWEVPETPRK